MCDLISRQTVLDAVRSYYDEFDFGNSIEDRIKALPSIDAAPVVRCKDCKYFYTYFNGEHDCKFHEWYKAEPKEDD